AACAARRASSSSVVFPARRSPLTSKIMPRAFSLGSHLACASPFIPRVRSPHLSQYPPPCCATCLIPQRLSSRTMKTHRSLDWGATQPHASKKGERMETQPVRRPPEKENRPFGLGKGALIIGLLIFVGILFAVPRLFGGDDDDSPAQINQPDNAPEQPLSNDVVSAEIGDLVVASSIDNNGCAADRSNSFSTGDTIYIVAED